MTPTRKAVKRKKRKRAPWIKTSLGKVVDGEAELQLFIVGGMTPYIWWQHQGLYMFGMPPSGARRVAERLLAFADWAEQGEKK